MRDICEGFRRIELKTVFRTSDAGLLKFLSKVRATQPAKVELEEFFGERLFSCSLTEAVRRGMAAAKWFGKPFSWLCVTNKGAEEVNRIALRMLGITEDVLDSGFPGDPKV